MEYRKIPAVFDILIPNWKKGPMLNAQKLRHVLVNKGKQREKKKKGEAEFISVGLLWVSKGGTEWSVSITCLTTKVSFILFSF